MSLGVGAFISRSCGSPNDDDDDGCFSSRCLYLSCWSKSAFDMLLSGTIWVRRMEYRLFRRMISAFDTWSDYCGGEWPLLRKERSSLSKVGPSADLLAAAFRRSIFDRSFSLHSTHASSRHHRKKIHRRSPEHSPPARYNEPTSDCSPTCHPACFLRRLYQIIPALSTSSHIVRRPLPDELFKDLLGYYAQQPVRRPMNGTTTATRLKRTAGTRQVAVLVLCQPSSHLSVHMWAVSSACASQGTSWCLPRHT